jgi:hypothetical protein|tara:strand:- start:3378 stop:4235 length:858 start_codon:yes stop_codon:yes gene_type:complete
MKTTLKKFDEIGISCLKQCLSKNSLKIFYETLLNISYFHLKKVGEHSKKLKNIYNSKKNIGDKLSSMYEIFEKNDKEMLYQLQKLFTSSNALRNILESPNIITNFRELLKIKKDVPLLIDGPGMFINRPKTKRLLYKWHSESHYYPKRRNFLNIWFPVFADKSDKNGTMYIKEKSHKLGDLPFNEYQGHDKETENKKNHFLQYEVPDNFVKNLKTYKAKLNVGDLLIFHRKAVHTSSFNYSKKYSFAVVFRVWDMSKDLTTSGDLAVSPYRDIGNGRPNLIVDVN